MPRLFYCPLEAYKERYTLQLSAPKTGWLERKWIEYGVDYQRVEGTEKLNHPKTIKNGVALDATGRSLVAMSQVAELLKLIDIEEMSSYDAIYLDDFWHPGIEAIPYAFAVKGQQCPAIYSNLWAQSVDKYDFTYKMRHWMRHYECGNAKVMRNIFVACDMLRDLVTDHIGPNCTTVGHPWCTEEVVSRMPPGVRDGTIERERKVVFSSRLDSEKRPFLMLAIAEELLGKNVIDKFVICSSSPGLKSNDPISGQIFSLIRALEKVHPGRFLVKTGLTKEQYYQELGTARVQLNTSLQDWISFTLLEASVAGCHPVYPFFRSFPDILDYRSGCLYEDRNVQQAVMLIRLAMIDAAFTKEQIQSRAWIHERYDTTWLRMLDVAGLWNERIENDFSREEVWQALKRCGSTT